MAGRLKRKLPVAGFVVLAFATAFSFSQERTHSNANHQLIVSSGRKVVIQSCEGTNNLRLVLHDLVLSGIASTQKFVKEGTLTKAQGDRAIAESYTAASELGPIDCQDLAKQLR